MPRPVGPPPEPNLTLVLAVKFFMNYYRKPIRPKNWLICFAAFGVFIFVIVSILSGSG